ncbi:MAG: hypothetical protein JSS14_15220 [Proteobacteria bacterium]|nr:hypothetical protein [Pseudomonadota bacterium]
MNYQTFFRKVTGTDERGRFEAFVAKTHPGLYITRTDYRGRESYSNEEVRLMWSAWQYRAELKPNAPLLSSETKQLFP